MQANLLCPHLCHYTHDLCRSSWQKRAMQAISDQNPNLCLHAACRSHPESICFIFFAISLSADLTNALCRKRDLETRQFPCSWRNRPRVAFLQNPARVPRYDERLGASALRRRHFLQHSADSCMIRRCSSQGRRTGSIEVHGILAPACTRTAGSREDQQKHKVIHNQQSAVSPK